MLGIMKYTGVYAAWAPAPSSRDTDRVQDIAGNLVVLDATRDEVAAITPLDRNG